MSLTESLCLLFQSNFSFWLNFDISKRGDRQKIAALSLKVRVERPRGNRVHWKKRIITGTMFNRKPEGHSGIAPKAEISTVTIATHES